jgi:hypothetical protein
VIRALAAAADGVDEALVLLRAHDRALILGAIGYLGFDVMVLWATFGAFGAAPKLALIWIAYLIGQLGGLIPLPGGIGGVDAGLIGALALYGTPLTAATAAVLAYRAVALWVPALFGATAFVALRRTLRREAHEIALCAPGEEIELIGVGPVIVRREMTPARSFRQREAREVPRGASAQLRFRRWRRSMRVERSERGPQ